MFSHLADPKLTPEGTPPQVVFLLGGPGAGKGTQAQNLVKYFGFKHISAGDCLREECIRPGSPYSEYIEKAMVEGAIVPVELTVHLMREKMKSMGWSDKDKYLIDGFPRNQNNLDGWVSLMGQIPILAVLVLDVSEETMMQRLCKRGETSGRCDDNIESMKKRFKVYREQTSYVIEYYESRGLVRRIPAEGTPQEVWGKIQKAFSDL